jgi:SAM-dependent methyltransferase
MFADQALNKVLSLRGVNTILDIGCGTGVHTKKFANAGKKVYGVDLYRHPGIGDHPNVTFYHLNFKDHFDIPPVDCVWASHVLEHQLNVHEFLTKALSILKPEGYLALTVPPAKNAIVGGHVTMWNAGLLMYNLILAGTSCVNVKIKHYGYNISVIVKYIPIKLPELKFDNGDIEALSAFFPRGYDFQGFNGAIKELNW